MGKGTAAFNNLSTQKLESQIIGKVYKITLSIMVNKTIP